VKLNWSYPLAAAVAAAVLAAVALVPRALADGPFNSPNGLPAAAQAPFSPGEVVGQFIGRFVMSADGTGEVLGYFPLIEGIGTNLFSSAEHSEKTALFSLRSDRMSLARIPNGAFNHFLLSGAAGAPIQYRMYYNLSPARDFAKPETFSTGRLIATFRIRNGMVTVTPIESHYSANLDLLDDEPFQYLAHTLELNKFGSAVAVHTTGGTIPTSLANGASIPLTGYLSAIGN